MASEEAVDLDDLPLYLATRGPRTSDDAAPQARIPLPEFMSPAAADLLEEFELRLIRQALEDAGGNQSRAARALATTRDRLRYKMKKYGLDGGDRPAGDETAHAEEEAIECLD